MTIRLVLVDDHPIVLQGLEQLFGLESDMQVVARCLTAEDAVAAIEGQQPDVCVLDVRMPGRNGLDVLRALQGKAIPTRVVVLTAAVEDEEMAEAVRLGVRGVVLKETAPQVLVDCVRRVHAGELVADNHAVIRSLEKAARREASAARLGGFLTPRELEVVRLVASGLRNKEIAARLAISEGTVKIHLHNTYEKLKIDGRLELMLYAQTHGLV